MTATARAQPPDLLTYEEYMEEFRTQPPTPQPCEILDGVRNMPPSPRPMHQIVIHNLDLLFTDLRRAGVPIRILPSPMDVLIRRAPLRVRQPDLLVFSAERYTANRVPDMPGPITVAPELVVEVLSPSETRRSLEGKIADFEPIGVDECWIVDIESETVEVLPLSQSEAEAPAVYSRGQAAQSVVFPDVAVNVGDMFER
jgi:Uma2 family endonuclease